MILCQRVVFCNVTWVATDSELGNSWEPGRVITKINLWVNCEHLLGMLCINQMKTSLADMKHFMENARG